MISYLSGKVIISKPDYIILDTGGVGYKIFVSIVEINETQKYDFFIHEHIREDCYDLYGFNKIEELELFQRLISVNGIGPKAAMAIMSSFEYEKIIQAIISEDISFFQSVSGIGRKVATKIILELKSKIAGLESENLLKSVDSGGEIIEALETLGYKKSEVQKMLPKIPENISSVEEKIRWCLKNINR